MTTIFSWPQYVNLQSKVDLVPFLYDAPSSWAEVVHQSTFAHEFRHDVDCFPEDHPHQLHQVGVAEGTAKRQ